MNFAAARCNNRAIHQESPVSFLMKGEVIYFLKAENLSFTERNKIKILLHLRKCYAIIWVYTMVQVPGTDE